MKAYTFTNLTVRPFPTMADLNNPWIFGGVQVIINVSGHDYSDEIKQLLSAKGIELYWFPLVEEGPNMGIDNIIRAVHVLQECYQENRKVILHCTCGNNRSRTVAEVFHYVKTGGHFDDEYKGYANHLLYNIGEGHLPVMDEIMAKFNELK